MAAYVFTEDVLAAKNAGMDAHVPKPLDLERLYQALVEAGTLRGNEGADEDDGLSVNPGHDVHI